MTYFTARLRTVRGRIDSACREFGRNPDDITLLAVSKRHSLDAIRDAARCGQVDFGENVMQEAVPKVKATRDLAIRWHFIGHLQSNKTRQAASHFDWVQTVDTPKIARRLDAQRPAEASPLQVCIQVHIGGEESKHGAEPAAVPELAAVIEAMPCLTLRGLMAIPPPAEDFEVQRGYFRQLREIKMALDEQGHALDTLSMGMSADLEAAIAEGSTMLRVGTALFGPRPPREG